MAGHATQAAGEAILQFHPDRAPSTRVVRNHIHMDDEAFDAVECRCRVAPRRQPEADAHGSNQCSWACVRADLRVASCSLRAVLERTPNEIGALGDRVRLALRILILLFE